MSLFTALHDIARAANISVLISAEGDDRIRVHVTPVQSAKAEKKLWPLSLVGTPAELDEQFAAAVAAYQPGALSVLDQALACAAANSTGKAAPAALPAPASSTAASDKPRRGRPPKNKTADDTPAGGAPEPQADPRQLSITDNTPPNPNDEVREERDGERETTSNGEEPLSNGVAATTADGAGLDVW
ncbi:PRTRC system protein E [Burkholderia gladioli]|uniref:PRTRC system protein E n=1 Tax=Burkholderia gladioli TaxID=28095 RepID=UPI00163E8AFA|nr:PRTRC system protein E [Burkholderia gladioli]